MRLLKTILHEIAIILLCVGFIMAVGTAGSSDCNTISDTQFYAQILFTFMLFGLSAICNISSMLIPSQNDENKAHSNTYCKNIGYSNYNSNL